MLRAFVTALIAAVGTIGIASAHSDKPKEATEKKAHAKDAPKGDAAKEKEKEKEKHGNDHGKSGHERKH